MAIKDLFQGLGGNKARFKEIETEDKLQNIVQQRKKSSNERELESRMEDKRQEMIKMKLSQLRKEDAREMFSSNIFKGKNMFKGGNTLLKEDKSVLDNGRHGFISKGNMFGN
jgi:hypothetical protein